MTVLTSERLVLSPMTAGDFEPLSNLWSIETFTRQIGLSPMTPETVWLRLLRDIGHWQVMGVGNWSVRRRSDNAWIGTVGIFDYRRDLEPAFGALEVGWGLHPDFQGQGYALEGVAAALRHADHDLKLERTACMISPDNAPSLRLARRAGFSERGDGFLRGERVCVFERIRS